MIRDTSDPYGVSAFTVCLSITLPSITVSTVQSVRQHAMHRMRSPSIPLPNIRWITHLLSLVWDGALMFIRSIPAMWPSLQAECALSIMIAATSIADRSFLLSYWPSPSSPLLPASSASSFGTTFSTNFPIQLGREMKRYCWNIVWSFVPGLWITILLAHFQAARCLPVPMIAITSSTIRSSSHSQSSGWAPKDCLSEPGALSTDSVNWVGKTTC